MSSEHMERRIEPRMSSRLSKPAFYAPLRSVVLPRWAALANNV